MPEHEDLFHRSTKDLTDAEKESVTVKVDTFSCNEWDLGVAHLTEHAIKTEGKGPVRLPDWLTLTEKRRHEWPVQ